MSYLWPFVTTLLPGKLPELRARICSLRDRVLFGAVGVVLRGGWWAEDRDLPRVPVACMVSGKAARNLATLMKKHLIGIGLQFRDEVHYHHDGKQDAMQADVVMEK